MGNILQLKIVLKEIKPLIWRRFLVSDFWTFDKLHKIVQKVMGWENYHLYEFKFGNIRIVPPDEGYLEENELDPKKVQIWQYVDKEKQKFEYVYDFGDDWEHEIIVEKIFEDKIEEHDKYPFCLEGARACPKEDCGGVSGYERFIGILETGKDPFGEDIKGLLGWLGNWEPERFDVDKINKKLGVHKGIV